MQKSLIKNWVPLILLTVLIFPPAFAQQQRPENWEEDGEIEDAQVVIEKDRVIELPAAARNYEKVPPLPVEENKADLDYSFNTYKLELGATQPPVRVFTIKDQPLDKYYANFIRAGFGNYLTPLAELYSSTKRNEKYLLNFHARHLSSRNGPVDEQNSGTSENMVNLNGKIFSKSITLGGLLDYQRNMVKFYGYSPQQEISRDTLKQIFNNFRTGLNLQSSNQFSDLHFKAGAYFNYLTSRLESEETQFDLNAEIKFMAGEDLIAKLESDFLFTSKKDPETIQRNLIRIRPTFVYSLEPFRFEGGFNVVSENDTLGNLDQLHFYPVFKVDYTLADEFIVYGGLEGDIMANTLRSITLENPWLEPGTPLFHTNKTIEFYGGIRGKVLDRISYNAGLSLANYKNMYFFINSSVDSTKFDILYDQGNTALFRFFGEVGLAREELYRLDLRADFYSYGTEDIGEAWHKPGYKVSLSGYYNLYEKILLNADFFVLGGIKAREVSTERAIDLDNVLDLSFKLDYLFSDRFSVFIDLNNIFGNNYQRLYNYPSQGFLGMLGASYSF